MWSPAARLREEGGGAVGLEGRAVATAGGARNAVGQRELDLRVLLFESVWHKCVGHTVSQKAMPTSDPTDSHT